MSAETRIGEGLAFIELRKQWIGVAMVAVLLMIAWQATPAHSGERSGKEVVDAVCIACHGTGANGAPKIGDRKAWSRRTAQVLTDEIG